MKAELKIRVLARLSEYRDSLNMPRKASVIALITELQRTPSDESEIEAGRLLFPVSTDLRNGVHDALRAFAKILREHSTDLRCAIRDSDRVHELADLIFQCPEPSVEPPATIPSHKEQTMKNTALLTELSESFACARNEYVKANAQKIFDVLVQSARVATSKGEKQSTMRVADFAGYTEMHYDLVVAEVKEIANTHGIKCMYTPADRDEAHALLTLSGWDTK